nr:MAG TPA: hypothetical protein [Caudoviricetes sp.]
MSINHKTHQLPIRTLLINSRLLGLNYLLLRDN